MTPGLPTSAAAANLDTVKCKLASETLRSCGHLQMQAVGWSMYPSVRPGDTLFVERAGVHSISAGDIVLLSREADGECRLVAHRVVGKTRSTLVARGDAMPQADPPFTASELLGRVTFLMREGRGIDPQKSPRFSQRAVSALVRRSEFAVRLVAGVHALRRNLRFPISLNRAVLCQDRCQN